ncbi:hypothetical protein [Haloferax sp. KTX1]|uniref:hypothetical protein n=1 Tax=Haloferax sp. KTX1 TaxID=2600597 RepID=UPI002105580A|nr:hypothetical protein [Haloferax sp. KTX1]
MVVAESVGVGSAVVVAVAGFVVAVAGFVVAVAGFVVADGDSPDVSIVGTPTQPERTISAASAASGRARKRAISRSASPRGKCFVTGRAK